MNDPILDAAQRFFLYGEHRIRVVMLGDDPWFVAIDVCAALGLSNATVALRALDSDEKGVSSTYPLDGRSGGVQQAAIVSEAGIYSLILRSRQATTPGTVAHAFRRWVTHDLIPTIRRQQLLQPQEAAEAFWFARRPRWFEIRRLVLLGLPFADVAVQVQRSHASVRNSVRRMFEVGLIRESDRMRVAFRRRKALRVDPQLSLALA